jgi:2-oxoglutarate/2-oxoacid ferredoxin oxidoreductase subunit alpha
MQQEPSAVMERRAGEPIVNDFSLQVATVNGSGSQSANKILMRTIFQMGVPVSGKNLFPSNIAGLPTWFTIRANKDGWIARAEEVDVMVVMNPETALEDMAKVRAGAIVVLNQDLKLDTQRTDITVYRVPFAQIVAGSCPDPKLRKLVTNIIYVGILAHLLELDMAQVEAAMQQVFKGKAKAIAINLEAAKAGLAWAEENLDKTQCPYRVEAMNATAGKMIIDGNSAAAIGCLMAGVQVLTWYPITPSSSLCESLIDLLKEHRTDADGKATFAVIQAEDELAALGMVVGAAWAGARSMTSTSGPGLSLMAEFTGLAYYAELPAVVFDIQRTGPSTGLPTRTQQGDLFSAAFLSHGDTKHLVLLPGSPVECYQFAYDAFDLAERFQTPVFVLSDLDLGMNDWMAEPFPYIEKRWDRGKVLTAEDLAKVESFARYKDVDGDGIPYRTLPGTPDPKAAFFTRGSGRNDKAQYSERPDDYVSQVDRLARKFETARQAVPKPVVQLEEGAQVGLIAYGTSDYAVEEARAVLAAQGLKTNYLRVRAFPFGAEIRDFVNACDRVYVIDQNRDAQLRMLLRLEFPELTMKFDSITHYTGLPLGAQFLTRAILDAEKGK